MRTQRCISPEIWKEGPDPGGLEGGFCLWALPHLPHFPLSTSVDSVAGSPLRCLLQFPIFLQCLSSLRLTRQPGSVESKGISKWSTFTSHLWGVCHLAPGVTVSLSCIKQGCFIYLTRLVNETRDQSTWHVPTSEQLVFLLSSLECRLHVALALTPPLGKKLR